MDDPTQAGLPASDGSPPASHLEPAVAATGAGGPDIRRGMLAWLAILAAGGIGSALLGHSEAGILFALAGVFVLAQATDAAVAYGGYHAWVRSSFPPQSAGGILFRVGVRAIVPVFGALLYAGLGASAWMAASDRPHRLAVVWCAAAAAICLTLAARPVADTITRALFRAGPLGRTRRLTARLVVIGLLLPVPARVLAPDLLAALKDGGGVLADAGGLTAQLFGEIALALAGVGWLVRRDWPATRERLGLTALRPAHFALIVLGFVAAIALNGLMEWTQRTYFHALWLEDSAMTKLIAGHLPLWTSLLLGVSAGVGEEVTVRGALQPRLGVLLSALLFACGHVQYSWFGMLSVGLLGVLLGGIRARANTTTAIVVHVLYDIFAAVTAGGS